MTSTAPAAASRSQDPAPVPERHGLPAGLLPRAGAGVAVLAGGAVAAVSGLALTGAAAPSLLYDPGAVVRWGLPLVTMTGDLAAAATIGVLALAAVALPMPLRPGPAGRQRPLAWSPAMTLVTVSSAVWALAVLVQLVFQYAQTSGTAMGDPAFGTQLGAFVRDTDAGRGLLVTLAVAATIAMVSAGVRSAGAVGLLFLLSLVALVPPALAGHASGTSSHETAVTALGLHLLGVCLWTGGLIGLVTLHRRLADDLPRAAARYSSLAGWAFALTGLSGAVSAAIRVPQLADLGSRYGVLVVLKVTALAVLGVAGAVHRRRALPALDAGEPRAFRRLASGELLVMGVTFGVAAALAASPPPDTGRRPVQSLAENLTGYPLPPPPTVSRWVTLWQPDLLWVVVVLLGGGLYLAGARRLRARGDRWPVLRSLSWFTGLAVLAYVTCGAPAVYGRVLFSAHMVAHMTLSMLVPVFLVLGAPVTLALRSLTARRDGTRGAREWLLAAVESRYARVLAFPPVAAFLFAGSLVFFYYSPLFGLALRTHVGHELMHVHFLAAGYLFAWVLIGLDPGPHRVSQPLRLITLMGAMAFHAFFGVALLSGSTVLAADYFGGLGRTWGPALLTDQRTGGGIAWGIGDIPSIVIAIVIAVQWAMSDDREARRLDRAADRDGDADLAAYNAMLARMAEQDRGA